MGKTKQKSRAGKKVSVFFIVFIIIEMLLVAGVAYIFRNDDVTPSFGGYSVFLMDSDEISSIPKDSLIIVENGSPGKDKIGKAVLCENVPDVGSTVLWLKDVTSKGENIDGVVYIVYQDDGTEYEMKSTDIIGIAPTYYITAGKIIRFISTPVGIAACAAAPIALWILLEMIIAGASHAGKKRGDDDEIYDDEEISIDDVLFGKDDATPLNFNKEESSNGMIADISFSDSVSGQTDADKEAEADENEEAEEAVEETETVEETEEPEPEHIVDVDETVSSTRKAASDSLEELMRMMEEEQKKLKEQLNK